MQHTILVVDDDPVMHQLMEHHLGRAGYQMIIANNGREAVEMARRQHPQLILLDIAMPEMGGMTALRELKQLDETKRIPVVIATVHTDAAIQQKCEALGAAVFLSKPLDCGLLLAELKRLLAAENA